jgi:hypothetical protein
MLPPLYIRHNVSGDVIDELERGPAIRLQVTEVKRRLADHFQIPIEAVRLLNDQNQEVTHKDSLETVDEVRFLHSLPEEFLQQLASGKHDLCDRPEVYRAHRQIVLAAVRYRGSQLAYASSELQDDREVVIAAICCARPSPGSALQYASLRLQQDSMLQLLAETLPTVRNRSKLTTVPQQLRGCKEFMVMALQNDGQALQFADQDLKSDPEVAFAAIRGVHYQHGAGLAQVVDLIPGSLWADRSFALEAVCYCAKAFDNVARMLKGNVEMVHDAFKNKFPQANLPDDITADKRFVIDLLSWRPTWLEHIAEPLKEDHDVVLAALKGNSDVFRFASEKLQNDKDFLLSALKVHSVKNRGFAFKHAPASLKADLEVARAAVQANSLMLEFALLPAKEDILDQQLKQRVLSRAIDREPGLIDRLDGKSIERMPESVRDVLKQQHEQSNQLQEEQLIQFQMDSDLSFLSPDLCADRQRVIAAVRMCGSQLQHVSSDLKDDLEIVHLAVMQDGLALEYAGIGAKSNRKVVLTAVRQNGLALAHAAFHLRVDNDIVAEACQQDPRAFCIVEKCMECFESFQDLYEDDDFLEFE